VNFQDRRGIVMIGGVRPLRLERAARHAAGGHT